MNNPQPFLVDYRYLIKSKTALAQYLACNLLPKGYHFYVASWIPEGKDPLTVDAKLILSYHTHVPKEKAYRRRKAGLSTVKYVRCGRLALLLATKGDSPFFQREAWKDVRDNPICFGGYSVGVNRQSGKVSVRLHREAQNELKRFILEWACKRDLAWWEAWVKAFPFLPFAGVRDNLFALIRFLNENRKSFRLPPVEWRECVRKEFKPEVVYLETPPEILELLRWETKKK